jgi:hypothetical protein
MGTRENKVNQTIKMPSTEGFRYDKERCHLRVQLTTLKESEAATNFSPKHANML